MSHLPLLYPSILLILGLIISCEAVDLVVGPKWRPTRESIDFNATRPFDPNKPLVRCSETPSEFHTCYLVNLYGMDDDDMPANVVGCKTWGPYPDGVPSTTASCVVLDEIECHGSRTWEKTVPCIRVTIYRFDTALLLSLLAGWMGVDRYYLGHIGLGVLKTITLGGVGLWWIIDLVLLVHGYYRPWDGSNWDGVY